MPYKSSGRLPNEKASKLGHLDVINSEHVNNLIKQFEEPASSNKGSNIQWDIQPSSNPLRLIFATDGSIQSVKSTSFPSKELAFVKTALIKLDQQELNKLNKSNPHPLLLRDLMTDAALYHATVFPLKHISMPNLNNYDATRHIISESFKDNRLEGEPYETLKWLAYEKWTTSKKPSPSFQCPHCESEINGIPYDQDSTNCPECQNLVLLSDMLGFHLDMSEFSVPQAVPQSYMNIHETLLLFTAIRKLWGINKNLLKETLFIKDGPLTLSSQYSKLVIPIRRFILFAKDDGVNINLIGQEKSGAFFDHLESIKYHAPDKSYFIPDSTYIRTEIQMTSNRKEPYGLRTNYGNKVFIKINQYHSIVLSIATGEYIENASSNNLIGFSEILSTIPNIITHMHECALMPIQLAHGVASLSSYPSSAILKLFAKI